MSKFSFVPRAGLRTALTLGVGLSILAAHMPAQAQEATTDDDSTRTMQTVTITATKREQTLQDVPVAVSVVSDETIEQAEIVDLNDLQSLVPSLHVGQHRGAVNQDVGVPDSCHAKLRVGRDVDP